MTMRTVLTALAGAVVALAIVGGFLALDRTVLHWYADKQASTKSEPAIGQDALLTRESVIYLVAENMCPRAPALAEQSLAPAPNFNRLTGRWSLRGKGTFMDALFTVGDRTGQVLPQTEAARVMIMGFRRAENC